MYEYLRIFLGYRHLSTRSDKTRPHCGTAGRYEHVRGVACVANMCFEKPRTSRCTPERRAQKCAVECGGLLTTLCSVIKNQGVKEAEEASSTMKKATRERHDYISAGWSRVGGSCVLWEHAELAAGPPWREFPERYAQARFACVSGRPWGFAFK